MAGTQKLIARHASVIGGSIAGLCAGRVLSDYFDNVTVYERDAVPDRPAQRTAVPQGRHLHLLLSRGAHEFDRLFPGLLDEMVAAGVPVIENSAVQLRFGAAGHVLSVDGTLPTKLAVYNPSRPYLEWQLRQRVRAIPGVELVHAGVVEPQYDAAARRVTGVLLTDGSVATADLVVDASGRGSRLPAWLQQWGFHRPPEDSVDVGISYASHRVRIPDGLVAEKLVVAGVSRNQPVGFGMLLHEGDVWTVTTFGVDGVEPPRDFNEICALADGILPASLALALKAGEPLGDTAFHRYPTSRWRRYDKLDALPAGIVPFGDAVASLNPTFGQGMTMTSIQAGNLRAALESGEPGLSSRLAKANAKTTRPVWTLNAVGDLILHRASGRRPWWYSPLSVLFDQFLGAAETDPVLAEWVLHRISLLDSLYLMPAPAIVARAARHHLQLWLAERRWAR